MTDDSKNTGSLIDEEELGQYVLIADTNSLPAAALALVRDYSLRNFMEYHASQYIYQDHFTPSIATVSGTKPTSIGQLSTAITALGTLLWPEKEHSLVTSKKRNCDPRFHEPLDWAECECSLSKHIEYSFLRSFVPFSRVRNSSSFCYGKMNREILIGYLDRLHSFQRRFFSLDLVI
jgi:hypothetical protein